MPQPRKFKTNAERQAAYRNRLALKRAAEERAAKDAPKAAKAKAL